MVEIKRYPKGHLRQSLYLFPILVRVGRDVLCTGRKVGCGHIRLKERTHVHVSCLFRYGQSFFRVVVRIVCVYVRV